jgi:DMSO/TMAO reductase YedYZ molybdopterin-dependent catalytic subunit
VRNQEVQIKLSYSLFWSVIFCLAFIACNGKKQTTDSSSDEATISKTVSVIGAVEHPLILSVDSLKQMTVVNDTGYNVVCRSGETRSALNNFKGVLLRDILEKARLKKSEHHNQNYCVLATATDGYSATFSWSELFNTENGKNVFVIFEENGQPIKDHGDMVLISKTDVKSAIRHIKFLKSLEVMEVKSIAK